ncbi:uncharacterized protein [Eurosta solidaginis]|uniref:uncharacterized protein n=1 Tax=Eurosta solidaginis TaxID=178769 RepID=UPI00353166A7
MQTIKTKFGQMIKVSMPWRTMLQNVAAAVVSLVVLSWLRLRPLGLFFLALFFFWLYKTRCSFEIKLTTESRRKFKIVKKKIMNTKQNFPALHFVCFAAAFASIAIVGHYMIGIFVPIALVFNILAISLVRSFVVIKRIVHTEAELKAWKAPKDLDTNSDDSISEANGNNDADIEDDDDEEFVPEINKINLAILENASEITSPTEDLEDEEHSDDIPSELLIPDSIPEINENSTDEDDELIPVIDAQKPGSSTAEPKIHFRKGHFKNDPNQSASSLSTSSSEESLSKGLHFPDHHTVVDGAASTKHIEARDSAALEPAGVAHMIVANQLPNIIGGLAIKWLTGGGAPTTTSKPKETELNSDSSQESEFEFLDHE